MRDRWCRTPHSTAFSSPENHTSSYGAFTFWWKFLIVFTIKSLTLQFMSDRRNSFFVNISSLYSKTIPVFRYLKSIIRFWIDLRVLVVSEFPKNFGLTFPILSKISNFSTLIFFLLRKSWIPFWCQNWFSGASF